MSLFKHWLVWRVKRFRVARRRTYFTKGSKRVSILPTSNTSFALRDATQKQLHHNSSFPPEESARARARLYDVIRIESAPPISAIVDSALLLEIPFGGLSVVLYPGRP